MEIALPSLETDDMETAITETDDSATASMSYVLREEAQLSQIWTAQDRAEHEQHFSEDVARLNDIRQRLESLHAQNALVWERFVSFTLECLLSERLREFLDELDVDVLMLNQQIVEVDCRIDRLRARIQGQRRMLDDKIGLLEPMAHRTSTQTHLNMMLARVEGLEAYLLDKKEMAPEADAPYKHPITLSGDLLYVRIRLLTTRVAIAASSRSKQLSELDAELAALLPEVDRYKADLAALSTQLECMSELSRYWLAYLNISRD